MSGAVNNNRTDEHNSKPRVLITRPKHQQAEFIDHCKQAGFEPQSLPCMDILPESSDLTAQDIKQAKLIFFTSRNAVEFAHNIVPFPWADSSEKMVCAVGRATTRMLSKLQQKTSHPPIAPYNSEAFVTWMKNQPLPATALIITGKGGRDVVETYLLEQGCNVVVKAVYKRVLPAISDAQRLKVFLEEPPDIISVTSDDVLRNLVNIAGPEYADVIRQLPLVVNSNRCAQLAERLDFELPAIVANPPGDEGQLAALQQWRSNS